MRKAFAVIDVLLRCGVLGSLYGAALGALYVGQFGIAEALQARDPLLLLSILSWPLPFGAWFGYLAGFIFGYSIGGFLGTGALMFLLFGREGDFWSRVLGTLYPSIWGAVFGLILGLHIRRGVRVLPRLAWLADSIYSTPLGGWLGWRPR